MSSSKSEIGTKCVCVSMCPIVLFSVFEVLKTKEFQWFIESLKAFEGSLRVVSRVIQGNI